MLQQTQVDTVIPYYKRFLNRFPSVKALAEADIDDVLPLWSGLGYYRRARSLHRAAGIIHNDFKGRFPKDYDEALSLPGIGPYTASAVLSIAFNQGYVVLDGNVERVMSRWLAVREDPRKPATKNFFQEELLQLLPPGHASDFNQALMELGALICSPKSPRCADCPLQNTCKAFKEGNPTRYPNKPPRKKQVPVTLRVGVIRHGSELYLERYSTDAKEAPPYLKGIWVFPSVELEGNQDPQEGETVLRSHLQKELGLNKLPRATPLGSIKHSITFRKISVEVGLFDLENQKKPSSSKNEEREVVWTKVEALKSDFGIASLTKKILKVYEKNT